VRFQNQFQAVLRRAGKPWMCETCRELLPPGRAYVHAEATVRSNGPRHQVIRTLNRRFCLRCFHKHATEEEPEVWARLQAIQDKRLAAKGEPKHTPSP
jgi:RNase P subunit RPR2